MPYILHYAGGRALAYTDSGDPAGYPLLIQHGLIASIEDTWLFERLAGLGVRLISAARPGYGASSPYQMRSVAEWGDLTALLVQELGLAEFDVLGMSSGAPYAYAIGQRFPQQARRLFIFSGTPALFDDEILALWPFPVDREAKLPALQALARDLFFKDLPPEALAHKDIRDSLANDCFGPALDFQIRCRDWGFALSEVPQPVFMRHCREDASVPLAAAEWTARRLPNCRLQVVEGDVHFSKEALDEFVLGTITPTLGA